MHVADHPSTFAPRNYIRSTCSFLDYADYHGKEKPGKRLFIPIARQILVNLD
jgi:hypothetical protein